jgi:hypothetical protein
LLRSKPSKNQNKITKMKKSVLLGILGLGVVATTAAYGQGGIVIGNYQAPYNKIVWGPGAENVGATVRSSDAPDLILSLWYGQGTLAEDALNSSMTLSFKTDSEAIGYYGYYNLANVVLPGWAPGQTWTFQVRADGTTPWGQVNAAASRSDLFFESANIQNIGGEPAGTPGFSAQSVGLVVVVPEPSTIALVGLGIAGLTMFRRRF